MQNLKLLITLFLLLLSFNSRANICDNNRLNLSLVLAIDVSSSVDKKEMKTQLEGYKNAFLDPQVQENLLSCNCTEVSVVLWAERATVALPFTTLDSLNKSLDIANFFQELSEVKADLSDHYNLSYTTEITNALRFSGEHLSRNSKSSNRQTVNISGDGYPRIYPKALANLRDLRNQLDYKGISINATPLVIYESVDFPAKSMNTNRLSAIPQRAPSSGTGYEDIADFYEKEVITPFGFVEKAYSYEAFPESIKKAIQRETCKVLM